MLILKWKLKIIGSSKFQRTFQEFYEKISKSLKKVSWMFQESFNKLSRKLFHFFIFHFSFFIFHQNKFWLIWFHFSFLIINIPEWSMNETIRVINSVLKTWASFLCSTMISFCHYLNVKNHLFLWYFLSFSFFWNDEIKSLCNIRMIRKVFLEKEQTFSTNFKSQTGQWSCLLSSIKKH